ncbi:MAG: radical SAM protein [Nitrospirae bacterium]|nr:radical SAM protein [Nitrospirota bacterium]
MIPCSIPQRRFTEFSSSLDKATIERRIPYMGIWELTHRCNQACRHCYCNLSLNDKRKKDELKLDEIKRILDEITEEGCLWLLFTGGDVLIREDFWDIYLYTLKKGILLEVFTNGSLITEDVAKYFAEFPPLGIEISIYGSDPSVHDNITRIRGSFEKTLKGINNLLRYKVSFSLKTMLMTLNYHDLPNMQNLARDLGVEFRFDCLICPRIDGEKTPLKYRLPVEKSVDLALQTERDLMIYKEIFSEFYKRDYNATFICTAGINAFNINPYGILSPCCMFLSFQYPLREGSFRDAWGKLIGDYGNGTRDFITPECRACSMVYICLSCAAWAELETKRLDGKVDYLCEHALYLEKRFLEKIREVKDEKALQEA